VSDDLTARVRTAHADGWQAIGGLFADRGGGALDLRDIRLSASGLPFPQWNNGDLTGPDPDLEGARAFYAQRSVPWGVRVPPELSWSGGRKLLHKRLMGADAHAEAAPPPSGVELRAAGPADLDVVVAIDAEAFGEPPELERAFLAPLLAAPAIADVVLATVDGEPAGTGYGVRSDGHAGPAVFIGGIGVLPAARGRGAGTAICEWLLARAFAQGARLAHLSPDDDRAARLYARLDFTEVPGLDVYVDV
jgi:ribosomal protein S18 acetylase RimI-like enzyme